MISRKDSIMPGRGPGFLQYRSLSGEVPGRIISTGGQDYQNKEDRIISTRRTGLSEQEDRIISQNMIYGSQGCELSCPFGGSPGRI